MPISQPTFKPSSISVSGASSEIITNLNLVLQNTEYSHALQNGIRSLFIRSRTNSKLQISFTSGESGIKFITIPQFNCFFLEEITFSGKILYIQSSTNNDVVEILETF